MDNITEKKLKSRTNFNFFNLEIPFVKELGIEPIAIDIGYDGTKTQSLYGRHTFPSLPVKMGLEEYLDDSGLGSNETYIQYKDSDDIVWFVGDLARNMIDNGRTYNEKELYGKERTETPQYKVLLRTGIALSLIKNMEDLKKPNYKIKCDNLKVITGLPDKWLNDTEKLISAFSGSHNFFIKVGGSEWIPVSFDLNVKEESKDIFVISQPKGTIFSIATNVFGDIINPGLLLSNNVLVFDGGFGTNDVYYSKKGQKADSTSFTDNSMRNVYEQTCRGIFKGTKENREVHIYELDTFIENNHKVTYSEGKDDKQVFDFKPIMERNIDYFANDVIDRLSTLYSKFQDVDYVICAGGTGEVYYPYFEKRIPSNVIIAKKENQNNPAENFTPVFSNVVGFFCNLMVYFNMMYKKNAENKPSKSKKASEEVASTKED